MKRVYSRNIVLLICKLPSHIPKRTLSSTKKLQTVVQACEPMRFNQSYVEHDIHYFMQLPNTVCLDCPILNMMQALINGLHVPSFASSTPVLFQRTVSWLLACAAQPSYPSHLLIVAAIALCLAARLDDDSMVDIPAWSSRHMHACDYSAFCSH